MNRKIETDIRLLRQKSSQIEPKEAQIIIKDLEDSLDLDKGIGLSAVQIGILKRVSIIRMKGCNLNLVNPKILEKGNRLRFKEERCLSIPGLSVDTARYKQISIENGDGKKYVLYGLEAIVCQHEIDHLNGLTILDRKWRKK